MPRSKLKLGEMLSQAGIISEIQLNSALSHQNNWGGRLGASLVKLGYVSEEDLLGFLARQLKLPRIDLADRPIADELLAYLPAQKARQYNVLPVARKEMHGTVYLLMAMTDPTNLTAIDDLQFITGCRVRPGLASEISIQNAIDRCYGPLPSVEEPARDAVSEIQAAGRLAGPMPVERNDETADEKLQRLLKILMEKGILTLRDYERLR